MGSNITAGKVKAIFSDYVKQGQFENAFIADDNGLPLLCYGSNMDIPETQAAIFARIRKTVAMVDERKGLGRVEEMVFDISGRKKIVCRNFDIKQKHLVLAITLDSQRHYKRLTSNLIHQLKSIWDI